MRPAAAPSERRGHRAPILALLAGGVVAGFGLGALALAVVLPAPEVSPLAPPAAPDVMHLHVDAAPSSRSWPAAFGSPPPPQVPVQVEWTPPDDLEEPPDEDDDYLPYTDHDYRLRGMVAHTADAEQGSGWALIESEIGIEVVRVGSELSGGETIVEITPHGVILQGFGAEFLLSFSDDDDYDDGGDFNQYDGRGGYDENTTDDHDDEDIHADDADVFDDASPWLRRP